MLGAVALSWLVRCERVVQSELHRRTSVSEQWPAVAGAFRVEYRRRMVRLFRVALQVFLFLLLLSVVVAIAGGYTGGAEKVVLAANVVALVWLVSRVRRIG